MDSSCFIFPLLSIFFPLVFYPFVGLAATVALSMADEAFPQGAEERFPNELVEPTEVR